MMPRDLNQIISEVIIFVHETQTPEHAENIILLVRPVFEKAARTSRKIDKKVEGPSSNYELLNYIVGTYDHLIKTHGYTKTREILEIPERLDIISSYIVEFYMNTEELEYHNEDEFLKYSPIAASLNGALNVCLRATADFPREDKHLNAVVDMMRKGFVLSKCILNLLTGGFTTEAFSTWRTLFEMSAILKILVENGPEVTDVYLRHMDYAMAYRGVHFSKEQIDEIFVEIKDKMSELNLKSKDMKRFIEYGWIHRLPDYGTRQPEYRFNFREGIERAAGFEEKHVYFELASELAHSSPILIYSNKKYFRNLSLKSLFDSAITFMQLFLKVFRLHQSKEAFDAFVNLHRHYVEELQRVYQDIDLIFPPKPKEKTDNE